MSKVDTTSTLETPFLMEGTPLGANWAGVTFQPSGWRRMTSVSCRSIPLTLTEPVQPQNEQTHCSEGRQVCAQIHRNHTQ